MKKRVLIIEPSGNLWGSEAVLLDFLKSAILDDWHIGVCCPPNSLLVKELKKYPVTIYESFIANLHLKGKGQRLIALIKLFFTILTFKPMLIYVNQAGATRLALLAGRLMNIPVIASVKLVEDVAYLESLRANEKALPRIICVSHYIHDLFKKNSKIEMNRLVMIYDPYLPRFNWEEEAQRPSNAGKNAFVCVGRLAYSKGQDVLLQALAELKARGIAATALFVGAASPGSTLGDDLLRLTTELDVEEMVQWVGAQDDFFSFGKDCVSWVTPSRHDPFPRVLLATLDSGNIPIAYAGSGGPAEMIHASGGGLLYGKESGESLANAMIEVMRMSEAERDAMIRKGRLWIGENCDPVKNSRKLTDQWEEAINNSKTASHEE